MREEQQNSELAQGKSNIGRVEGSVDLIAQLYLLSQINSTVQYYIKHMKLNKLLETAAVGVVKGIGQFHSEAPQTLETSTTPPEQDILTFDRILRSTAERNPDLLEKITKLDEKFNQAYENNLKKLNQGAESLLQDGNLENSFLVLHKLNNGALERVLTQHLVRSGQNNESIKDIILLKNFVTALSQATTAIVKEGSLHAGEAGYNLAKLSSALTDSLPKEYKEAFSTQLENTVNALKYLSPIGYAAYQGYKVCDKVMDTMLLPAEMLTVATSGFLSGVIDTIEDGKQADLITFYEQTKEQSWEEFMGTLYSSCTALCSNAYNDFALSYNAALTKRQKLLNTLADKGVEEGIELKPHKPTPELLMFETVAKSKLPIQETLGHNNSESDIYTNAISIVNGAAVEGVNMALAGTRAVGGMLTKGLFGLSSESGKLFGSLVGMVSNSRSDGNNLER